MLRIAIRDFRLLARFRTGLFVITILCLSSAFACTLLLEGKAYRSYLDELRNQPTDRTFFVSCSHPSPDTVPSLWTSLLQADIPAMDAVTISNDGISGLYYDTVSNPSPYYTPYGRLFTEAEMENGAHVILLSTAAIGALPPSQRDAIWDTPCSLDGFPYTPIGSYYCMGDAEHPMDDFYDLLLPTDMAIPLNAFLAAHKSADCLRVVFSRPLTDGELAALQATVAPFVSDLHVQYPTRSHRALQNMLMAFLEYWGILALALLGTAGVLLHFLGQILPKYRIYRLCGAKAGTLFSMLSLQVLLLLFLGFLSAILTSAVFYRIMGEGILAPLPIWASLLPFAIGMGLAFPVTVFRMEKAIRGTGKGGCLS